MKEALKLVIGVIYFNILPFFVYGQIAPANDLLGKKYNKVFDKEILKEYNHKVFTDSNMIVTRVDVYVDLKNDYIDLVNHLLEHYKSNSDSISYSKYVTKDFSFKDLEFFDNESIMTVYSDSYVYVFILDRKKITLQHYKNGKEDK